MHFLRSSNSSTPSIEQFNNISTPRLRTRSSLDRFTVARNRTRIPSSNSSQPEPIELPTANNLLKASEPKMDDDPQFSRDKKSSEDARDPPPLKGKKVRTEGGRFVKASRSWTNMRTSSSPSDSSSSYGRMPSELSDASHTGPNYPRPLTATTNQQSWSTEAQPNLDTDSSADGHKHLEKSRTKRFFAGDWVRSKGKGRVEAYDGANSTRSGTSQLASAHSTMISHRNFTSSSTGSSGQYSSRALADYNQLAKQHGLEHLEYESSEEEIADAETRGPRFLRKSTSLNKIVFLAIKPFTKKESTTDLHKPTEALAHKSLVDLSCLGHAPFQLPYQFAIGDLILPTPISNLAAYLYECRKSPGIFRISGREDSIRELYGHYASQYAKSSDPNRVQHAVGSTSLPIHLRYEINDVASCFKRIVMGLPGGLLGSAALFRAFAGIQEKFPNSNEQSEFQARIQVELIASAIDTIDAPYRKALVMGFLGLASAIGYETQKECHPESMTYASLSVVLAPVMQGNIPTDNQGFDRAASKKQAKNVIDVAKMLITRWQEVVNYLRAKRSQPSYRATSRLTSVGSGSSKRLSWVQEDPLLEDQLSAAQEDNASDMPRSRAVQQNLEVLNTGRQRRMSSREMAMVSQSAKSSSEEPVRKSLTPEEGYQSRLDHPFTDDGGQNGQNIPRSLPNTPKKSSIGGLGLGTPIAKTPSTARSSSSSHRPSSRNTSFSRPISREEYRSLSASRLNRDQAFENDTTDGALDLDQKSYRHPSLRVSKSHEFATNALGASDYELEAARCGSPLRKDPRNRSYANLSRRHVQDTPATAKEAGNEVKYQQPPNEHWHFQSASTSAGRPGEDLVPHSTRQNSVRKIAQKFEDVQRLSCELVATDNSSLPGNACSVVDPRQAITVAPGVESQIVRPNQMHSRHDPPVNSPIAESQIPKPHFGHGRSRDSKSSSPSPAKTIMPRPSDIRTGSNVASNSQYSNARPTRARIGSISPHTHRRSSHASSPFQRASYAQGQCPVGRDLPPRPLGPAPPLPTGNNLGDPSRVASLEKMRAHHSRETLAAPYASPSPGRSLSSLRSRRASSPLITVQSISPPPPLPQMPDRISSSHGPAYTAPAPATSLRSPLRALTDRISHPRRGIPVEISANNTLTQGQSLAQASPSGSIPRATADARSDSWTQFLVPGPLTSAGTCDVTDSEAAMTTDETFPQWQFADVFSEVDAVDSEYAREFLLLLRNNMSPDAARGSVPALKREMDVARLVQGAWAMHFLYLESRIVEGGTEGKMVDQV